jgi:hypothetical protein
MVEVGHELQFPNSHKFTGNMGNMGNKGQEAYSRKGFCSQKLFPVCSPSGNRLILIGTVCMGLSAIGHARPRAAFAERCSRAQQGAISVDAL